MKRPPLWFWDGWQNATNSWCWKKKMDLLPNPRCNRGKWRSCFFGMPGWPKNEMSSWWWLFLGGQPKKCSVNPSLFWQRFISQKDLLHWLSSLLSDDDPVKMYFYFWSLDMSLLHHPDESSSSLSAWLIFTKYDPSLDSKKPNHWKSVKWFQLPKKRWWCVSTTHHWRMRKTNLR